MRCPLVPMLLGGLLLLGWPSALEASSGTWPRERHPSILCTADELPAIRKRLDRAPYRDWFKQLLSWAEAAHKGRIEGYSEFDKTFRIQVAAHAHLLTGEERHARTAVRWLQNLKMARDGGDWGTKLHARNDGLVRLCLAYDALAPWLQRHPDDDAHFRRLLRNEAEDLRKAWVVWYDFHQNNHQLRQFGALCLAAITLSNEPEARSWFKFGKRQFDRAYAAQHLSDGGWAEGHNYLRYAMQVYFFYFLAARRQLGIDYFSRPGIRKRWAWSQAIRMPDGYRPNFDDASLSTLPSWYLTSIYGTSAGHYAWALEHMPRRLPFGFGAAASICLYDDEVKARPPPLHTLRVFERAGNAVFRSDWSADALYVFALAENGKARTGGGGHEHPDGGSFVLHGGGRLWLLDGGYLGNAEKHRVNGADHHNLILVDGKGPEYSPLRAGLKNVGADAFFVHSKEQAAHPTSPMVQIRMRYENTDVLRSLVFVEGTHVVVIDALRSKRPRTFTHLLHGHAGGTSGGTARLVPGGAVWRHDEDELHAQVLGGAPVSYALTSMEHALQHGEARTHRVLRSTQRGRTAVFVSLLRIGSVGDKPLNIGRTSMKEGGEILHYEVDGRMVTLAVGLSGPGSFRFLSGGEDPRRVNGPGFAGGWGAYPPHTQGQ
ncbi:heparinase II/III family protein [bacterium AH-315-F18]|nr:heparinase II/III family protein [bacterium AH-315-F18]